MAAVTVDHFGFSFPLAHEQEFDALGKYTIMYTFAQSLAMVIAPKDDKLAGGNLLLWLVVNPVLVFWVSALQLLLYINIYYSTLY